MFVCLDSPDPCAALLRGEDAAQEIVSPQTFGSALDALGVGPIVSIGKRRPLPEALAAELGP